MDQIRRSPLSPISPTSRPSIGRPSMASSPPLNDSHLYEEDVNQRPYLPDCWTDTKRMAALMSPFRAREANPEGWDLKMTFWINCITKWSLHSHNAVFSAEDVIKAFERGSKRADIQCIQLVLSHMKRQKNVIALDEFRAMTNSANKTWMGWGLNTFVVKPFSFGLSLVSGSKNNPISEDILPEVNLKTKFVSTQTLQVMSEELNKVINKLNDIDCIRFEHLFNKCKNQLNINLENFEVIINNLEIENKVKLFVDNNIKIVKIGKNANIKESDIALIRLESAKEVLDNEIEKLETDIESIREEAKVCVRNKNKEKAILLLKKKKRVETKMANKVTQLDNIEVLIDQLINSSSHQLVLQAFQRANEALKSSKTKPEDVENTMTDVEETLEVLNEIASEVNRPLVSGDNEDVEEELDELLNEINDQKVNESRAKAEDDELSRVLNDLSVNDQSLTETEDKTSNRVPLAAN